MTWISAIVSFRVHLPNSISLLVVAFTLGLRHAFDADHIAAIDNVTRRFLQEKRYPVTIGLYFSLGHSSIVVIATILIAALSGLIYNGFESYGQVSQVIGPSISATFLLLVAIANGFAVVAVAKSLQRTSLGLSEEEIDVNDFLNQNGGLLCRLFHKFFKIIDAPWKMYIVGLLFGLGFDTAAEVTLLSLAAIQASEGQSVWLILFLAFLFTCGMTLLDSIDGIAMVGVYGFAFVSPSKKLYYNLIISSVTFIFTLFIALLQILGIFQAVYSLEGPFWSFVEASGDRFDIIGLGLLGSFLLAWLLSSWYFRHTQKVDVENKEQTIESVEFKPATIENV